MDDKLIKAHKEALEKNDIDNFVSFTAISVSAGRLAEGMRDDPLYRDPLIADMLQSSKGDDSVHIPNKFSSCICLIVGLCNDIKEPSLL